MHFFLSAKAGRGGGCREESWQVVRGTSRQEDDSSSGRHVRPLQPLPSRQTQLDGEERDVDDDDNGGDDDDVVSDDGDGGDGGGNGR